MNEGSSNKSSDDLMDLHSFTNVPLPHPAHSTKIPPPPPPPPRHPTKSISSTTNMDTPQPPLYSESIDENLKNYSNNLYDAPQTNITMDSDIHNVIESSLQKQYENGLSNHYNQKSVDYYSSTHIEDYYSDFSKMLRTSSEPGVLLPLRADLFESYLAPILIILSQIPQFSNLILQHQFLVLSYKPNWWNREKCSENPLLLQEIQRLVAFLNGNSKRAFASLYNLIFCVNKLVTEEIESVSDFYNFFMDNILYFMARTDGSFKVPLEKLFKVEAAYEADEDERDEDYYNIPIGNDYIHSTLYETIHKNFFQTENKSDHLFLLKIPDVFSISFESGANSLESGFKVEETFYPQIYSYEHKNILTDVDEELRKLKSRKNELNQKIFRLRVFNGKSVPKLLADTAKHLRSESHNFEREEILEEQNFELDNVKNEKIDNIIDNFISEKDKYIAASQSIAEISSTISDLLKNANSEVRLIEEQALILQGSKYNIDQLLDSNTKASFEPWILTGVILNAVQFYYREKKSSDWIGINICAETCKSYSTSKLTFDDIQDLIKKYTEHDFGDGMTLIYVRESVFYTGDFNPLNKTLQGFIDKDNTKLKEQYDIWLKGAESSESVDSDILSSESTGSVMGADQQQQREIENEENLDKEAAQSLNDVNPFDDE